MANSFANKESSIPLRPRSKDLPVPEPEPPKGAEPDSKPFQRRGSILPNPKKKGKAYNLYIDVDVMERITEMAKAQGISVSQAVSALLRAALEQMEG